MQTRYIRAQLDQKLDSPKGKQKSGSAAQQCQQHALGEELANQAPVAGTKRLADGRLSLPGRRPCQLKVGDIGARDQQHQSDGCEQKEQCGANITGSIPLKTSHRRAHSSMSLVRLAYAAGDRLHVGLGLFSGDTWFEACNDPEVVAPTILAFGMCAKRDPSVGRFKGFGYLQRKLEAWRHDPDNHAALAVDHYGLTHQARIRAEAPLPQTVTQDHHWIVPRLILLRENGTSEHWLDMQQ